MMKRDLQGLATRATHARARAGGYRSRQTSERSGAPSATAYEGSSQPSNAPKLSPAVQRTKRDAERCANLDVIFGPCYAAAPLG